jgi:hypothetical protein
VRSSCSGTAYSASYGCSSCHALLQRGYVAGRLDGQEVLEEVDGQRAFVRFLGPGLSWLAEAWRRGEAGLLPTVLLGFSGWISRTRRTWRRLRWLI